MALLARIGGPADVAGHPDQATKLLLGISHRSIADDKVAAVILVPTEAELARQEGRDYEPASALLARIRTARAASEAAAKPARRPRVPGATPAPAKAKPARQRTNGRTARSR